MRWKRVTHTSGVMRVLKRRGFVVLVAAAIIAQAHSGVANSAAPMSVPMGVRERHAGWAREGCSEEAAFVELRLPPIPNPLRGLAFVFHMREGQGQGDLKTPTSVEALGELPLLKKVPERKCAMCGALSSKLATDSSHAASACDTCHSYS